MKDKRLPKCVYFSHGAYYLVKKNKWMRLGKDLPAAMSAYGRLMAPSGGMNALIDQTMERAGERCKPNTLKQYGVAGRKIKSAFVEFRPDQVKPLHIVQFLDHYRASPSVANRLRTLLKLAFDLAVMQGLCESNPVYSIPTARENKRDRYLTDDEYRRIWRAASPVLRCIMDICYLTGQRIGDVIKINLADITPEGILFQPEKTTDKAGRGKKLLVAMTPDIESVIARAKALHGPVTRLALFGLKKGGAPRKYSGVADQWKSACQRAGVADAHLHDIRAKALTDAKAQGLNPQALALHSTEAMTIRYLRGLETPTAHGPKMAMKTGKS